MGGSNIDHNYCHGIARSPYQGGYPVAGIYLDNGSTLKTVEANVVAMSSDGLGFYAFNAPNRANVIRGNFYAGPLGKIAEENVVAGNEAVNLGWHNIVALSKGRSLTNAGDWLPNNGQGAAYHAGDFNGDGKSDILFAYSDGAAWHNSVALSNSVSFTNVGDWLPSNGQGAMYHVGDFNGDGKSDILFAYSDGAAWHNSVALSKGVGFTNVGDWLPNNGQGAAYHVGDFNGDGKSDILFAYSDGVAWHNSVALSNGVSFMNVGDWLPNNGQGAAYHVGDFNADGKSDILFAYFDGAGWHNSVALSSGIGFTNVGDWLPNNGQGAAYHVGDVNGDGKSDLLFAYSDGAAWHNTVALSNGMNFTNVGDWLPNNGQGTAYLVGDFDGDRRTDLLFAYNQGWPDAAQSVIAAVGPRK